LQVGFAHYNVEDVIRNKLHLICGLQNNVVSYLSTDTTKKIEVFACAAAAAAAAAAAGLSYSQQH
jgi:hypothetical protein